MDIKIIHWWIIWCLSHHKTLKVVTLLHPLTRIGVILEVFFQLEGYWGVINAPAEPLSVGCFTENKMFCTWFFLPTTNFLGLLHADQKIPKAGTLGELILRIFRYIILTHLCWEDFDPFLMSYKVFLLDLDIDIYIISLNYWLLH